VLTIFANKQSSTLSFRIVATMKLSAVYFAMITLFGSVLLSTKHGFADAKQLTSNDNVAEAKPLKDNDAPDAGSDPISHIFSRKAHVTLANLQGSTLSPEEAPYLESAIIAAYVNVHQGDHDMHIVNASIITFVDLNQVGHRKKNLRTLAYTPAYGKAKTHGDYSMYLTWNCNMCGDKAGFWDRRGLTESATTTNAVAVENEKLRGLFSKLNERTFCKMLRDGPYEIFNAVKDCRIRLE
jgi:hypothetical protein